VRPGHPVILTFERLRLAAASNERKRRKVSPNTVKERERLWQSQVDRGRTSRARGMWAAAERGPAYAHRARCDRREVARRLPARAPRSPALPSPRRNPRGRHEPTEPTRRRYGVAGLAARRGRLSPRAVAPARSRRRRTSAAQRADPLAANTLGQLLEQRHREPERGAAIRPAGRRSLPVDPRAVPSLLARSLASLLAIGVETRTRLRAARPKAHDRLGRDSALGSSRGSLS